MGNYSTRDDANGGDSGDEPVSIGMHRQDFLITVKVHQARTAPSRQVVALTNRSI
jgi:hypothetical protein